MLHADELLSPHVMPRVPLMSQVKSGLRRTGTWLLGMAWLGLVFAGVAIAFTPSPHSPILGWSLLGLAAIIFLVLMDRWIRVFPALMAIGTLSSLGWLFTGHATGNPAVRISRPTALGAALFFAANCALGLSFVGRKLHVVDRIALLALVVGFFWQAVDNHVTVPALGVGFCGLFIAWAYDRIQRRRGPNCHSGSGLGSFSSHTAK
jgi:hypothetical protein